MRQYKENGIKLLLEYPANVRDLMSLLPTRRLHQIDFSRLQHIKTTFIRGDFRHLESDTVLTAPLIGAGRRLKKLLIYILIEHQSELDRLMPLRLADAQLQIFRYQVRAWSRSHASRRGMWLSPVLPVVFYTGLRPWRQVGTLADLIQRGEEFRAVTPIVERPLFLNLPELPPEQLERDGGYFGWFLRLVQQRKSPFREFQQWLARVVTHLEGMPPEERNRWRDLLYYIGAMIYHERRPGEHDALQDCVERSVESNELREELSEMGKTAAGVLIEKGRLEGESRAAITTRQQTLVRLLRRRFGKVPSRVVRTVEATTDADQLDAWLDGVVTAGTLDELRIPAAK